jgi:hypothetical protein
MCFPQSSSGPDAKPGGHRLDVLDTTYDFKAHSRPSGAGPANVLGLSCGPALWPKLARGRDEKSCLTLRPALASRQRGQPGRQLQRLVRTQRAQRKGDGAAGECDAARAVRHTRRNGCRWTDRGRPIWLPVPGARAAQRIATGDAAEKRVVVLTDSVKLRRGRRMERAARRNGGAGHALG